MTSDREQDLTAYDHARKLFEELRTWVEKRFDKERDYIDRRNEHRRAAIDMLADSVAASESALIRDVANPGWVKTEMDRLSDRQDKTDEALSIDGWVKKSFDAQGRTLRWLLGLVVAALLALCANLAVLATKGL